MFLAVMIVLALFVLPPWLGLVAVSVGIAVEVAEVGFWVRFLRRYRVRTGVEALVGVHGVVIEECNPRGRVRLRGEIWHASCPGGARVGERVAVVGVHGLTLEVERPSTDVQSGGTVERRGGTEKGPGEGALWFRKDVPPANSPSPARRSFKSLGSMSAAGRLDLSLSRETNTTSLSRLQLSAELRGILRKSVDFPKPRDS